MQINPYTPGAGMMPAYIAGRDVLLENAKNYLESIKHCYPQRSIVYFGLRGVGKTVLLNSIELSADEKDIQYIHIEAGESRHFTAKLISSINKFLPKFSKVEAAKEWVAKCKTLMRSFSLTYDIKGNTIELKPIEADDFESSGVFSDDLTDIFVAIGQAAKKSNNSIAIFVDEMQYLSEEEINAMIVALHRCNQLRLPIIAFCAGLPKIKKAVGEACSYSERLFQFEEIGALTEEQAKNAIVNPAKELGIEYSSEAIQEIIAITEGYPYFIQEYCNTIWNDLSEDCKKIEHKFVKSKEAKFFAKLDSGFFSVRYERSSPLERTFMTAMVKCGKLPCTISNVAKIMGRTVTQISPTRGQLINKGMIYSVRHAEIDFTVPQFSAFIHRINPSLDLG